VWGSVAPVYWPSATDAKVSFFAFSPAPQNGINGLVVATGQKGVPKLKYTVPLTTVNQPDLMVATPVKDQNKTSGGGKVSFGMKHALTCIGFEARGSGKVITSIEVEGVSVSGTMSVDATLNSGKLDWVADAVPSTPYKVTAGITPEKPLTGDMSSGLTANDGYLMMIPQLLTGAAKITVKIKGDADVVFTGDKLGKEWKAGERITYRIGLADPWSLILEQVAGSWSDFMAPNAVTSQSYRVVLKGGTDWVASVKSGAEYFKISPASGVNNKTLAVFFLTANTSSIPREAVVTFASSKGGVPVDVAFRQSGNESYVSPTSLGYESTSFVNQKAFKIKVPTGNSWRISNFRVSASYPLTNTNKNLTLTFDTNNWSATAGNNIEVMGLSTDQEVVSAASSQPEGCYTYYTLNVDVLDGAKKIISTTPVDIMHGRNPYPVITPDQYVTIDGLKWAVGNLIIDNKTIGWPENIRGVTISGPNDGGLYFQFGSLIGWAGGATGDGTGRGKDLNVPYCINMVRPTLILNSLQWPDVKTWNGVSVVPKNHELGFDARTGVGDPCNYYLGGGWRLPTTEEFKALTKGGFSSGVWTIQGEIIQGSSSSQFRYNNNGVVLEFPASGHRSWFLGGFGSIGTICHSWSALQLNESEGRCATITSGGVFMSNTNRKAYGFPLRCVHD
ncbi:MAG: hypothetical protein ACRCSQ_04275, partial [Bacteroidales bacterium]